MIHVHIKIPVRPKPKPSARVGRWGQVYMPKDVKDYMTMVKDYIPADKYEIMQKNKHRPVSVVIECYFKIPAKIKHESQRVDFMLKNRYTHKPDFDNLEKMIMDSLKGVAWNDDSQIIKCTTTKGYSLEESTGICISYYTDEQD